MSETGSLFLIVAVLYFAECIAAVPRDAVVFRSRGRRFSLRCMGRAFGTRTHAFAVLNPIPFFPGILVCQPWPMAVTANAAAPLAAPDIEASGPSAPETLEVPVGEERNLRVDGRELLAGGRVWFRWASHGEADRFSAWLGELHRRPAADRMAHITQELTRRTQLPDIEARLHRVNRELALSRLCGGLLFLTVFGLCPALFAAGYWTMWWPGALAIGLLLHALAVRERIRVSRGLLGFRGTSLWVDALKGAVSPLASMRTAEHLGRHALASFEPAAVALVLAEPSEFEAAARGALVRLRRDTGTHAEFAVRFEAALDRLLRRGGLRLGHLSLPPASDDTAVQSYCPRCRAEYIVPEGVCAHCEGIRLVRLDRNAAAARRWLFARLERRRGHRSRS